MSPHNGVCNEEESKKSCKSYKEIIESLPKIERWTNELDLYQYQGFWYTHGFMEGIMSVQEHFKPQPTDIYLCSCPKTGTTWLKAMSFAVATRNSFGDASTSTTNSLLTSTPHECIPFLEIDLVRNTFKRDPKFPFLATHIPYTALPKFILESGCKIIYMCRDPKDTFVSLLHFQKNYHNSLETKTQICFETEFDRFCQGKSNCGPYWDHVLGFWKASLESPERILFLKYEDVKKDNLFYIRRLAEFLNKPFSKEEEDEGVPQRIMDLCSFSNLSSLEVNKTGKYHVLAKMGINNGAFFRKGEVGDWKNHFTKEMMERVDQITKQKLDGTGLTFGVSSPSLLH